MGLTSENQGVMALSAKKRSRVSSGFFAALLLVVLILVVAMFERGRLLVLADTPSVNGPWMDKTLSPDRRADLVLQEMTLDEKIALLHGNGMPGWPRAVPHANPCLGNGGAGFVLGVPRLGIPIIQMSDAAYGVRSSGDNGRYSTALPSNASSAGLGAPMGRADHGLIGISSRCSLSNCARSRASSGIVARAYVIGTWPQ